jgi:hypothetical protein
MRPWLVGALLLLGAARAAADPFEVGPYLQDVRSDGAVVAWEGSAETEGEVSVEVLGETRRFAAPRALSHRVRVTDLPAGSWPYRASVGRVQRTGTIETAAVGDRPFTFIVYGDSRGGHSTHARVIADMVAQQPDLVLSTGDMVAEGGSERDWLRLFDLLQPLVHSTPLYAAAGNHEYAGDPSLALFKRFLVRPAEAAITAVPEWREGPIYYAFRIGNSEFVVLDSTRFGEAPQREWLSRTLDLAEHTPGVRHLFVVYHHPPFAVGDLCGALAQLDTWVPELERHHVRAVFAGHIHAYEHLEHGGVHYFVTGGAGAPLDSRLDDCPGYNEQTLMVYHAAPHFLQVRVDGPSVHLDAVGLGGELLDSLRLDGSERPPRPRPNADVPSPHETNPVLALWGLVIFVSAWRMQRQRRR